MERLTDTMSDAEISALYGLTRTAATHARKQLGVKSYAEKHGKRRYRDSYEPKPGAKRVFSHRLSGVDEHYFSSIGTEDRAYWLGFFLADGWIVTEKGTPTGFAIALHERDKEALQDLQNRLGGSNMLRRTRPGSNLLQLKLTSGVAARQLILHGVVPRKSRVATLPKLSDELMPHLIRGYFDGDGSISVRGVTLTMDFTSGSKVLLDQIRVHLERVAGVKPNLTPDRASWKLRFYAENAVRLGCYIYGRPAHNLFCLSRKKQKFLSYLETDAGHSWEQLLPVLGSAPSR